ncbi:hypothetical protein [Clostridium rectalis]|uniref:hypothetical protein n=1 Tax=Clostridium rectalis TaxID=2040295 RepID=UPI003C12C200
MKTSSLTKGGLLSGLGFILTYLSTILPTNKMFVLILASCLIPLTILLTNSKTGFIVYITTSLLNILLIGFKGQVFLYIIFFGLYGIVKLLIEKLRKMYLEIILKLSFLNICLFITYFLYKTLFINININKFPIDSNKAIPIFLIICQIIFLVYDYAITLFIATINKKLKHI